MALTDVTDGSRVIKEGIGAMKLTLTGTVKVGDLVDAAGVQADANAGKPAKFIAGQPGVSGDEITAYRAAVIGGVSGGALGTAVFLSDTAGGYSETASATSRQVVGRMTSATEMYICPEDFAEKSFVNATFAAADVVGTTSAKLIFTATQRVKVTRISEIHAVVAGQAGTLDVERLQGTEAVGGGNGDALLGTTKIDLEGTINTVQSPTLTSTAAHLILEAGDRVALKLASGAATSLVNANITVELERC